MLKGAAHILVQKDRSSNEILRKQCNGNNEYNGAVGIYYPNSDKNHRRFLYKAGRKSEKILFDKVFQSVTKHLNSRNIDPLFTWKGVTNAILSERISYQRERILEIEESRRSADEALNAEKKNLDEETQKAIEESAKENDLRLDRCDEEKETLENNIKDLTKIKDQLLYDREWLSVKSEELEEIPLLYVEEEAEAYPGEIKDLILTVLEDSLEDIKGDPRKVEIVKDIIDSNDYESLGKTRSTELERILKGYRKMTKTIKRDIEKLGFKVRTDGTHYKAYYNNDDRYIITLSSTSGDHRAGKNTISEAKNLFFSPWIVKLSLQIKSIKQKSTDALFKVHQSLFC